MDNELIAIQTNEQGEQRVSARELHKALGLKKHFADWWKQYQDMFVEGNDFMGAPQSAPIKNGNGRVQYLDDYSLSVDMAKHISMMTKTERGNQIRDYFIQVENEHRELLNNPQYQMAMGLKSAQVLLDQKDKEIEVMKPKAVMADAITASDEAISIGALARILSTSGYKTGQQRLFQQLRDEGYLITRRGRNFNHPKQQYLDQQLFDLDEKPYFKPNGETGVSLTTLVTGKGQQYFINKYINTEA
ncbi:phage antirepressor KilAC domain-containing protein [Weissella viridescens]|uniref:phage antirepressor KilAC domain-containing protein n=1 Tax=Weissella viridescens TaxID=1629 RepID=UPI003AF26C74